MGRHRRCWMAAGCTHADVWRQQILQLRQQSTGTCGAMRSYAELCGGCAPEAVRFSSICAAKLFMASKGLPAMPAAAPGVWRVKAKVSLRRLECIDSECFPSTIFQAVQCSA